MSMSELERLLDARISQGTQGESDPLHTSDLEGLRMVMREGLTETVDAQHAEGGGISR